MKINAINNNQTSFGAVYKVQARLNTIKHFDANIAQAAKNKGKSVVAFVEKAAGQAMVEDKFQFMRIGYFVKDKLSTPEKAVFNEIVGLKDSFNK